MLRRIVWVVGLLVLALALVGCGGGKAAEEGAATEAPKEAAAVGVTAEQVQPLFDKGACGSCHVIAGIEGAVGTVGPNLCEVGEEVQEGKETIAEIIEEIVEPNKTITPGYPEGVMPTTFGDLFSQEELELMAKYLAQLSCEE